MRQKVRHNTYGFTLIELLVVIAIIGLLSSVVLASLNSARTKAQDSARLSDMDQVITALSLYYIDHGKFPCHAYQNSAQSNYLAPLITEGYLTRAPHDPTEDPDVGKYYDYESFKTSSVGTCGAIAHLGFKLKEPGAECSGSSVATNISGHCHIFLYEPLNCSEPYLANGSTIPPDCQLLEDDYDDNDW